MSHCGLDARWRAGRTSAGLKPLSRVHSDMSVEIVPPTERSCERCGRRDVWDEASENWVIAVEDSAERSSAGSRASPDDGERLVGDPDCIHEWDINGGYNPVREST